MKRILIALVVVGCGLKCNTALADKYLMGSGAKTCGSWTQASPTVKHWKVSWLLGYLSGINYFVKPEMFSGQDVAAIESWMDNYCRAHPRDVLVTGANDLSIELMKRASGNNAEVKQK